MASTDLQIFDRKLMCQNRKRAQKMRGDIKIWHIMAQNLADRLYDVKRKFAKALIGAPAPYLLSEQKMVKDKVLHITSSAPYDLENECNFVIADEEDLPFENGSFDLMMSFGNLHLVNDLPKALGEIKRCLKEDGLFLASCIGGESLAPLREAFLSAQNECEKGVSAKIFPFIDVKTAGDLLQKTGFGLPVVDCDDYILSFQTPLHLLHLFKKMGEQNCLTQRQKKPLRRKTLWRACEILQNLCGDDEGGIKIKFSLINLTGFAPSKTHPKPLKPKTANTSLAKALGTKEIKF